MKAQDVIAILEHVSDKTKAQHSARFFKTGASEYGEGDCFLGIKTPVLRKISRDFKNMRLSEVKKLLASPYHEIRFVGLAILVLKCNKPTSDEMHALYSFYMRNIAAVNNWDLVDMSAPQIVGRYLKEHANERRILYTLANSPNLWERRIAIIATFAFIRENDFDDAINIAEILRNDSEDLMHKAVGWMLREIGKRDQQTEETFLKKYAATMPRTMLRYAIEKFEEPLRQKYLNVPLH